LTLLMVLFLVLWVISTIDLKKFEKFKEGLGDFGNPAAVQTATTEAGPPSGVGNSAVSTTTTTSTIPNTATGTDGTFTGSTTTVAGGKPELSATQLTALATTVNQAVDASGLTTVVDVHIDQRGLVISVKTDDVLFDSGSAALRPEASKIVTTLTPTLTDIANDVVVEGYTDSRPLRKAGYTNWDLSVDRAVAVLKMMSGANGIDDSRLSATGYGDTHPVATGTDDASLAKNRRVEIVVVAGPDASSSSSTASSTPAPATPTGASVPGTTPSPPSLLAQTTTTLPTTQPAEPASTTPGTTAGSTTGTPAGSSATTPATSKSP
jgi:chemotaxis protein MotB